MVYEKLTKENVSGILEKLGAYLSESRYSSDAKHSDMRKLGCQYYQDFMKLDLGFKEKRLIETMQGATSNPEKSEIPKEAILYKRKGNYYYNYYWDSSTNKKYFSLKEVEADVDNYYVICPSIPTIGHYKYIEELDVLIGTDYNFVSAKEGVPSHFQRSKTMIVLTRDKNLYQISNSNTAAILPTANCYVHLEDNDLEEDGYSHSLVDEFKKMFIQPIMNIGANNFIAIETLEAIQQFCAYNAKLEIKDGPKQRKVDELTAIPLVDKKVEIPEDFKISNEPFNRTVIQKLKENTCVIRWRLYSTRTDESCDGLRIYIEGKNVHACKLNNANKFIRTTISNIKPENFLSCSMDDINPDDLKGTILQYYGEIINDIPTKYRSVLLMSFIREPKIEQVFKMGLSKLIFNSIEEGNYSFIEYISDILGAKIDKKDENIFRFLGVNKYQFGKYKTLIETVKHTNAIYAIKYIKSIYGSDISALDNKSFDATLAAITDVIKAEGSSYYWYSNLRDIIICLHNCKEYLDRHNDANLVKFFLSLVPGIIKMNDYQVTRLYSDYINMVYRIDDFKNFKLGFKTKEEVREMHDAAVSIYNLKRYEYKSKAFKDQLVKVNGLVYENEEDDFCIVIPTEPGDLANEGLTLHHCVKSYIEKVADGRTNIVFIRKKDDKTKPFFTVEVSNEKTIEQVHGFGNRNADTEPGLEDFIKKWAKNKRLKVSSINKIR